MTTKARPFILCAVGAMALMGSPVAHAEDILSYLFNGNVGGVPTQPRYATPMPFADEGLSRERAPARVYVTRSAGQAYCVRTCDGRYFPITVTEGQTRAESCNNFCPATETKVFYGSAIDNAATDKGKQYSAMPNAFKYRTELVAGCTCNGKDPTGLAAVKIEDDPTLRKGDIVAGANGLMVNRGPDRRGASLNLSPVSASIRAKYGRFPVVALQ